MKFADNLRNLRIARGLSQTALAKGLGTSQAAITAWENSRREPDFRTIQRLADFFAVPMSSLLPYDDSTDASYAIEVVNNFTNNPKLKQIYNKTKFMTDKDLDVVLNVIDALSQKRPD